MAGKRNATQIKIGISDKDRRKIADGLSRLLADTFPLYLKPLMVRMIALPTSAANQRSGRKFAVSGGHF